MKINKLISIALLVLSLVGCAHQEQRFDIDHSALQLRQFQKREFATSNQLEMMKAAIGALQDLGFVVNSANVELGLVSAQMQISDSSGFSQYMQSWVFEETTISSVKQWDATINIDRFGDVCNVRANFVAKALNKVGGIIRSEPILEPSFYQEFFNRVDKSVFLTKNKL